MKTFTRACLTFASLGIITNAAAQIGINTLTPNSKAALEIKSSDKGILLPIIEDTSVLTGFRKPLPDTTGFLIYNDAPSKQKFRFWNGRFWEPVNPLGTDPQENVTAPQKLTVRGDSLNARYATVKAKSFEGYGTTPLGGIIMWSGSISGTFDANGKGLGSMDGWYLCNGNSVTDAQSPYNGKNTPNLTGKFIAGYSGSGDYAAIGNGPGGSNSVTLTVDNLPAHNHGVSIKTDPAGSHNHYISSGGDRGPGGGGREPYNWNQQPTKNYTNTAPDHTHDINGNTKTTGGIYTFDSRINPPRLNPPINCFYFSCKVGSTNYYSDNDEINYILAYPGTYVADLNSVETQARNTYYYYDINKVDPSTGAKTYQFGFMSDINTSSFSLNGATCQSNNNYTGVGFVNSDYDQAYPVGATIISNEKWTVQPFDNRPAYYVLAFIMRIK